MTEPVPTDPVCNDSLEQITQRLDALVQTFEQHPLIPVREQVMEMLGLIDTLHRRGLQHLVATLQAQGATLLGQLAQEPAIALLLTLYDLTPPGPREQAEQALENIGPLVAAQGGSFELLDVVEGVVHLRLSSAGQDDADGLAALKQTIELALRQDLPGFRALELHGPEPPKAPPPSGGGFISLQHIVRAVRTVKRPVFTAVGPVESFPPGTLKGLVVEGLPILLCNLNGEFFGYRNVCPGSALPLDGGKLNGYVLLCPWHNCLYDVRTGKRVDGRSGRLEVIPVAVREGMLQLTLKTESMPLLSAPRQGPLTSGSGS